MSRAEQRPAGAAPMMDDGGAFPIFRKYFQNLGNAIALAARALRTKSFAGYNLKPRMVYGIEIAKHKAAHP